MAINILVSGSDGQLGRELQFVAQLFTNPDIAKIDLTHANKVNNHKAFSDYVFHFKNRESLDITDASAIETFCTKTDVKAIINCAAYTAVDLAEQEQEQAFLINEVAVENLSKVSRKLSISLIHISTDYVFDGENRAPYTEDDTAEPKNIYGKSKLAGEQAMQVIDPPNSVILRTSWLYSPFGNNFVATMLKLGATRGELNIVSDQIGSPTSARELADSILQLLPKLLNESKYEKVKIYHLGNTGSCSWYDFANEIFSLKKIKCHVVPILTSDYPTPASRPLFSVLNKEAFSKDFKIEMSSWQKALALLINEFE